MRWEIVLQNRMRGERRAIEGSGGKKVDQF